MLLCITTEEENVWYTDAAAYHTNDWFVVSVLDTMNTELSAVSICAKEVSTVEEVCIFLAIASCKKTFATVVTDSQEACRRYLIGRIGKAANKMLQNTTVKAANIIWKAEHKSLAENQAVHAAA